MSKIQLSLCSFLKKKQLNVLNLNNKNAKRKINIEKSLVIKQINRPRLITFTSDINVVDLS